MLQRYFFDGGQLSVQAVGRRTVTSAGPACTRVCRDYDLKWAELNRQMSGRRSGDRRAFPSLSASAARPFLHRFSL